MDRAHLVAAVSGAAAFCIGQLPILLASRVDDAPVDDPGWFLNSGRNAGIIAFAVAAFAAALFLHKNISPRHFVTYVAGATLAMAVVLAAVGPGTIFPIVILAGAIVIGAASALGAGLGYAARRVRTRRE